MKAFYLLAPIAAALAGCSVYTAPPPVAVSPTYVTPPPSTVVLGAGAAQIDSDGDGHTDAVDRFPHDATRY